MVTNTKTLPCIRVRASITVEAAMILPIFLLFFILFLGLFRVELVEMQVNQALSYTVSKLAMETGVDLLPDVKSRMVFIDQLKEQGCKESYLQNGWQGVRLSTVQSDLTMMRLTATYHINLPISLFGKQFVEVTQSAVARRWTGYAKEMYQNDRWVYVTPYGIAYHKSPSCRYLDLSIWATRRGGISTMRNQDGEKYHPCDICVNGANETLYITDYGNVYHESLGCRNLKRTLYRVMLSEVKGRSPCQKCYGVK